MTNERRPDGGRGTDRGTDEGADPPPPAPQADRKEPSAGGAYEDMGAFLEEARAFRRLLSTADRTPLTAWAEGEFERLRQEVRAASDRLSAAVAAHGTGRDPSTEATAVMLAVYVRSARRRLARLSEELRARSAAAGRRTCPRGHESASHDYCDECGAAMPHPVEKGTAVVTNSGTGFVVHGTVVGTVVQSGALGVPVRHPARAAGGDASSPAAQGAPAGERPPADVRARPRPDAREWGAGSGPDAGSPAAESRRLVAELAEQAAPGRVVPLHVQVVGGGERGEPLRPFPLPDGGAVLFVTVHAPGLLAVDDLQQELRVYPGRDSDVLRFGLRTVHPGLHRVTVRAFAGGSFLGEVGCQISVEPGGVTRDGPVRSAPLPSVAFDPGEVTLQVLRDRDSGAFSFQLLSETCYAPETFRFRGGSPREATERIYAELRRAAGTPGDPQRLRRRLRSHGVQLWTSAVPEAVQRQFWEQADRITSFTVLGEHDIVPWELLYPLNEGRPDHGFLAEWLPVVRRVFGQDRVRTLALTGAAFVVPPGSPQDTAQEVRALRARLGPGVADAGVLTERAALTELVERGHAGVLHFACHNAFTGAGSCVTMADGPFDPVDLASAAQVRSLRRDHPLVFFNACRSAGEIDWFGSSLGWAPQFLRAGAGAFVGTLWPVRSDSALRFAEAFYEHLLPRRQPLGRASLAARQAIRDQDGDPTWLAYAVYGSPGATARAAG